MSGRNRRGYVNEPRGRHLAASLLKVSAALLFIGFLSFALAVGILGDHRTETAREDGTTSASPTEGGATSPDAVSEASPAEETAAPDLLASATPFATGTETGTPDLVASPSTPTGGGTPTGSTPDAVTSPSTARAPSPTTPPDLVTQPSTGTAPAPGTTPEPTDDDNEEKVKPPKTDDDALVPVGLNSTIPLIALAAGWELRRRRKRR